MSGGIVAPLRRDKKRDFASADGDDLLHSKVIQVLCTEEGELPWRSFGSRVHLLRHQRNDDILQELGRVYARDALQKWVPDAQVSSVTAVRDGDRLTLRIRFKGRTREVVVQA